MAESSFRQVVRFFLRLLLILSVIIILDRGAGTLLKYFYFRQESGVGYLTTYSIDSTLADILIFGSSRANHSYVPDILEENLHRTVYNTGRDGTYILFNYAIFKAITKRYNPKLIIIDIRPEDLGYSAREYDILSLLLPYYQRHPEIRRIIDLKGPFERIKRISAIYPYNSLLLQIAMGNLKHNKDRVPDNKGYVPLLGKLENVTIDTTKIIKCNIDKNKTGALKDIVSTCRQKNIDLVFVYSPTWRIIEDSFCNNILSDFCTEYGIRYLNMSNLPVFVSNQGYFSDIYHLNDQGARVFSKLVVDQISQNK